MGASGGNERTSVAVVGGGQAGLAVSYYLSKRGIDHVVLEAADRVGASWRSRWDSLRLFTPAQFDGLPGLPFPAPAGTFPTKDAMAEYLEGYAERFGLPVRLDARVERLARAGERFLLRAGGRTIEADRVVIASGAYQVRRVPGYAADLDPAIVQRHVAEYRNPGQLREGPVLVVGAGNSGAEVAIEVARAGHRTTLAGRSTGRIPPAAHAFGGRPFWFLANRVLSLSTPIGRRLRPKVLGHGTPLIGLSMRDVTRAGVERVPRVAGAREGLPVLEDGRVVEVRNVVWCTGFGYDFSWIDLPVTGPDGLLEHEGGVVKSQPGLYCVGLPFLTKLASAFIGGVGEDARQLVDRVAADVAAAPEPAAGRAAPSYATAER